jgi:hypothetical protein
LIIFDFFQASVKSSTGSLTLPYVNSKQDQQISAITEFASQVGSVVFAGPSECYPNDRLNFQGY